MRSVLSSSDVIKIIDSMCDTLEKEKNYLSELDGAIGDGDHGVNIAKCFREVKKKLPENADKDVGTIFKNIGMVILNSVGGAMGALYGTLFLKASKEVTALKRLLREAASPSKLNKRLFILEEHDFRARK